MLLAPRCSHAGGGRGADGGELVAAEVPDKPDADQRHCDGDDKEHDDQDHRQALPRWVHGGEYG